jgi:putative peptidoglycan lipid II flippase
VVSTAVLHRRVGDLDGPRVRRTYVRLAVATVPPAAAGWLVARLVSDVMGEGMPGSVAALVAGGAVLMAGYFALARLLHIEETAVLLRSVGIGGR